jgi:prophage tail gpP-like protein
LAIFGPRGGLITQSEQNAVAQPDRIAGAALGELDHLLGDGIRPRMVIIAQTEGSADVGVSAHHRRNRFRLESLILEQMMDSHRSRLARVLTKSN